MDNLSSRFKQDWKTVLSWGIPEPYDEDRSYSKQEEAYLLALKRIIDVLPGLITLWIICEYEAGHPEPWGMTAELERLQRLAKEVYDGQGS